MLNPFAGFDPFAPEFLHRMFLEDFLLTSVAEALVLARFLIRPMPAGGGALVRRRPFALRHPITSLYDHDMNRLWVLPLLLWSFQAHRVLVSIMDDASTGLTSPSPIDLWPRFFGALFALCLLLSGRVLVTTLRRPCLNSPELTGAYRTSALYAVCAVILEGFFLFALWSLPSTYG